MSTPPPPPSEPYAPPPAPPGGNAEMHPAIPAVVSLFFPGIGLLLLPSRDRVKDALAIFGLYFVGIGASIVLVPVLVGFCCLFIMMLYNIAAAIHSYDEAILLEGGKPLLFKNGFRIFKEG